MASVVARNWRVRGDEVLEVFMAARQLHSE
jgi:hypothetical protein